jgi:hypothetical protein
MNLFGYDFTLEFSVTKQEEKKKKRKGYSRKAWTESETNALLRFRNENKSWREIANLMNRTEASCYTRYHKIHSKGKHENSKPV